MNPSFPPFFTVFLNLKGRYSFLKTILAESLIRTTAATKNYTPGLTGKIWQYRRPSRHRARQLELTGQVVH